VSSPLTAIRTALLTAIAGIDGTGDYTHDLSDSDRVLYAIGEPQVVPCVMLYGLRWAKRINDSGFGDYAVTYSMAYFAVVAADSELGHSAQAEAMAHDLALALEANRDVVAIDDGEVIDIVLESGEISDNTLDHEELGGIGWVEGSIVLYAITSTGV